MKYPLTIIAIVLALSAAIQAAVPNTMNYQGRLTDDQGQPITGTVSMTFTIYDAETEGESKWTETHPSVSVNDGLFSVVLGEGTPAVPIEDTVFWGGYYDRNRWLEITVDGETVIPRTKLSSSPYALQAGWTLVDNVLYTSSETYSIARKGNVVWDYGGYHVNLGYYCTTGSIYNTEGRFCTVSGGNSNTARAIDEWGGQGGSTVSGGVDNSAIGAYCTVGGGKRNTARGDNNAYGFSIVAGGAWNMAYGIGATVAGGIQDTANGYCAMIPGGYLNRASGRFSFAA